MLDSKKAEKYISDRIFAAMQEIGDEVEAEMKQLAPVDTGFMRDNISHTCEIVGEDVELDFISAADYSVYVEFGTSRMDAQPFFRPPLVGIEKRIKEKVEG